MTTHAAPPANARTADAFAARLSQAGLGSLEILSVYLGDRLGLYRALRDGGPLTPVELGSHAGIDRRYAREWLEQQAASGILEVDAVAAGPEDWRFTLPEPYAEALLDPDSPHSISPLARSIVACAKVLPQLMEA